MGVPILTAIFLLSFYNRLAIDRNTLKPVKKFTG